VSPDGQWCVVEVTTWDVEEDESLSNLCLLATDGKAQKQLTNPAGKNTGPVWAPDGNSIAFTSQRAGDDWPQIYVIAPSGGEARRVSRIAVAPSGLMWSADSRTIYSIGWTWPDAADDAAHKAKEKSLKEAKSKAVVIVDTQYRIWDNLKPITKGWLASTSLIWMASRTIGAFAGIRSCGPRRGTSSTFRTRITGSSSRTVRCCGTRKCSHGSICISGEDGRGKYR